MTYTQQVSIRGTRRAYSFENGYTASVINYGAGSNEGLWELAVMYNGVVVYDTPITDDVIGRLTLDEAEKICNQIARLPPR